MERLLTDIKSRWPAIAEFNLHLHNGRAMALLFAALLAAGSAAAFGFDDVAQRAGAAECSSAAHAGRLRHGDVIGECRSAHAATCFATQS